MGASVPPLQGQPGGAALVTTPQTGAPIRSAVEQASDAARAAIAANGTALPASIVQPPGGAPARVAAGDPSGRGGEFAPPLTKELPAGGQPPAPVAGQPPAGQQPPGTEGQQPPGDKTAAEGQPGTEQQETPEQQAAREAEEAEAALAIETPIMIGEGDAAIPLVLHADTPENAAALQELVTMAVTSREQSILLDSAQRQVQQAEEMREYAGVDPVGFTTAMIGNDIETGETLTLFLLSQPSMFERLKPTLQKLLANPAAELPSLANKVKADRSDQRDKANVAIAEGREIRENLQDVQDTVAALLPKDMPEAQRRFAFRNMLRDLKDYADSNGLRTLPVHQVPQLLADSMSALGIDPEAAAAQAAVAAARRSGGSRVTGRPALPAAGVRRAPPTAAPRAPAPKPTGKAFVTSAATRKAAAIPPAGAGSPTNATTLFSTRKADGSTMSTEEAIAAHRERLNRGIKSY